MAQETDARSEADRKAIDSAYLRLAGAMEREASSLPHGPDRDALEACACRLRGPRGLRSV